MPAEALARDEALLDEVHPGDATLVRWYTVRSTAVVLGLGLHHRAAEIVDLDRTRARGTEVLSRRAGGGALLLEPDGMLCAAICLALPDARVAADLTESYRWLGSIFAAALVDLGIADARRIEIEQARADVAGLKAHADPLLNTCFGMLSPHEVVINGARKVVGLAQIRRRHAALFQIGVLLRDQSGLADFVKVPSERTRETLRADLRRRTAGLGVDFDVQALANNVMSGIRSG